MSTFLTAIEGTIVSTAIPSIVSDLKGMELMNWVFSIYLLTSAVATPIFGKLADLYGRKRIFFAGTILFLLGSVLSGMSATMTQLIWFRAFQGIGTGAIMPVTFTMVGDLYPFEQRAKIQGWISSVWGIAGIVGPLVGGFFVEQLTWHWVFYINVPFGIIAMIMVGLWFQESFEKQKKPIDYPGVILFSIGLISLLFALQIGGESQQWTSNLVIGLFAAAVFFIALFLWVETKVSEPMVPLSLFTIRNIVIANAGGFILSAVLIGMTAYIPVWVQGILGLKATNAGITLAPMSVSWTIGAFIGGRLLVKRGAKVTSHIGMVFLLASCAGLIAANLESTQIYLMWITLLAGFGFGMTLTVYTVIVQSSVGWSMRGAATASNTLFRTLGQTVGVAVFGTYINQNNSRQLLDTRVSVDEMNNLIDPNISEQMPPEIRDILREVLENGLHGVFWLLLVLAAAGAAVVVLLPRTRRGTSYENS
jgi:EmrB/QacA subfamily drug resistance transporter